ncbi:MAG TPA: DUF4962 domain-containing protein [archaeon]|nr:DUF4962 domain-containing protein [archaeon]
MLNSSGTQTIYLLLHGNKFVKYLHFTLLLFLALLPACHWDGGPGPLDKEVYRNLSRYYGIHPRILLTSDEGSRLLPKLSSSHGWLWERFLEDLPDNLAAAQELPEELGRGHADLASDLAFAWRMTGEDSLLQQAKDYLLALCRRKVWDPEYDLLHGHLLMGTALAYDWLYPRLNRAQKSLITERLGNEAEAQYRKIVDQRAWYRNQYLQNHAHVNYGGLAFAAVALYGEDARAQDWLGICEEFFRKVFEVSPADGASIEGLNYGNYALEFSLRYAELARTVLGRDYYSSPWLANYPDYILHSLLPRPVESEWAMTFGDSPRHGNYHGPEPQLFLLASHYNKPAAQWLGKKLIGLKPRGLNSASWWAILWYDPSIREADPADFPTMKHFTDIGQVMMRSSWLDTSATMIGFKCGPFMGSAQSREAAVDLGCAHGHPDAGSFQVYSRGRMLAIDPGYTLFKKTENHNTLLVKDKGQLGEEEPWFAAGEAIRFRQFPGIVQTSSTAEYEYVIGDACSAYHPALGLKKFLRHLLFIKPDLIIVADELTLDDRGVLYTYPADTLDLTGALKYDAGYVVGTRGQAGFTFEGIPGTYSVGVSYIDNAPLSGSYALLVDGDTLHSWQDTVLATDTHLEIVPDVKLSPGRQVVFNANPLGEGASLVKMIVYSPNIPMERDIKWLLHFEQGTVLERKFTRIEASTKDDLILDVYPIAPERRNHNWGIYNIKEPRDIKETIRLEIKPFFFDSSTTLITLFHIRTKSSLPLEWMRADMLGSRAHIRWYRESKLFVLDFDPLKREISLQK